MNEAVLRKEIDHPKYERPVLALTPEPRNPGTPGWVVPCPEISGFTFRVLSVDPSNSMFDFLWSKKPSHTLPFSRVERGIQFVVTLENASRRFNLS